MHKIISFFIDLKNCFQGHLSSYILSWGKVDFFCFTNLKVLLTLSIENKVHNEYDSQLKDLIIVWKSLKKKGNKMQN